MEPFTTLRTTTVVFAAADVDTDQIVPARFLTGTSRQGLGAACFADRRTRDDFPAWPPHGACLVAGPNFGCGSSREHAVWALVQAGIRVVIAPSLADIFRTNALKNGLLAFTVPPAAHAALAAAPGAEVTIDLAAQTLQLPDGTDAPFAVDAFARTLLLAGRDELDLLAEQDAAITAWEEARAWMP